LIRRIALFGSVGLAALATLAFAAAAVAKTIHVRPGDSIQSAVKRADSGDKVLVHRGKYKERSRTCAFEPDRTCAVSVTEDDIRLVGKKGAVLKAKGEQDDGIGVGTTLEAACLTDRSKRLQGSLIKGLKVRGFAEDGVFLACVEDWRITKTEAVDNAEYGLFPSHSVDGRIDHSFTSGANDTGFYIGQSRDARMDHNEATDNVSGYEIENSTDVRADHNLSEGNTAGILSFALPNLDIKVNDANRVDHNEVRQNNRPNTCLDPEETVCSVPPGTGILLLAADNNRVDSNEVTGNNSFGIAVADYCVALGVPAAECAALDINPAPDGNQVLSNRVTGNGTSPDPSLPSVFAVDLAWDLSGSGNCWSQNQAGTTFPSPLPAC
jgi:parallel beta-helix repeat protein